MKMVLVVTLPGNSTQPARLFVCDSGISFPQQMLLYDGRLTGQVTLSVAPSSIYPTVEHP